MFLSGVPVDHVLARLAAAGGKEIESGKIENPRSSAALAVNTFGWFVERPQMLPPFDAKVADKAVLAVDVEYCARFPWRGGRHPWLDAIVITDQSLLGVESKRFEPYRDHKVVALSEAYDRDVWGDRMGSYLQLRDALRAKTLAFRHLDAAQLLKHAFGLVTDGRRRKLRPRLVYLFAEPPTVSASTLANHRAEVARFASLVEGAEVTFSALSYRDWIATWNESDPAVIAHGNAILEAFQP